LARLIRTEKEVEGRFEDVWLVVEEDPLQQWPEGPLDVVGRPAVRLDGPERVRGEARFTADLQLPGMLHAAILRSPHAHARVRRIDLARALAAPGVRGALGPGEANGLEEEAGYAGAPVAAVAADTFAQARTALGLVDVEWEELEAVLDPQEAVARGQLTTEPERHERGDFERALAEADVVVERTYRTSVVLHNSMETHQAVCEWIGDTLNVYISTQYIWGVRAEVAGALGIPADKVRVVCEFMGGGFGSKNGAGEYTFVAAELARRTGRPVRCALTRREENTAAGNRNATIQKLVVGARSDGTIVALGGEFVNAVGWSGWSTMTDGPMRMLYACDNVRTVCYGAKINTSPMKPFRAPGFVEGTFGLESLIDELAARLDLDPFELRRKNYADSNNGTPYSSKNLAACYELAQKHWDRRHEVRARSGSTWKHGVGMASQIWYGGGGPPSYAWTRVGSDGRIAVVTAMQDIGTGTSTVMAQIAAEELGVPLDRVDVVLGDSARGPYVTLSAGSSTVPSLGPAVRAAAADAKRQILEIAAQRFDLEEGVLDIRNGTVVSVDGSLSVPLEELLGVLGSAQILGKGARGPNPAGMSVNTFGVQVAEVAVDIETGEVRVERIAAVHDVGRIVNPLGARSQVEGGIIQGIGHTLSEVRLLDPETGRVLTTTLDSYRMPTIADVPEIVCEFVDKPDEHLTSLGSKGLGEPPIVPTAAAIANAIRDATGADVHELPISREEMLRALREAEQRARGGAKEPVGAR
jgi:xanthine dehydrogenase YagR molybdenum-binding subunit